MGRGEASCRQVGGNAPLRPETNGVVERFSQTLKYEHLYQREIDQAAAFAEEVEIACSPSTTRCDPVKPWTSDWTHQRRHLAGRGRPTRGRGLREQRACPAPLREAARRPAGAGRLRAG